MGEPTNCFTGTASATPAARLHSILFKVREVRMARAWVQVHGAPAIIFRTLVLIPDYHSNRSAQCDPEFGAGLDLDFVLLVAGSRESALAWSSAGHLRLNVALRERHPRRAPIDNAADGTAMGFTIPNS